jgi:hypothetical protein
MRVHHEMRFPVSALDLICAALSLIVIQLSDNADAGPGPDRGSEPRHFERSPLQSRSFC